MRMNYPLGHKPTPEELTEDAEAEAWMDKGTTYMTPLRRGNEQ